MLLDGRIDGGPPLHLLLDSGASHITLDARASARSAISAVSESHLVGAGESPVRSVRSGIAGAVQVGPLQFRNCLVDMAPGGLAEGIDGVIPLSLFDRFLIRLDLPGRTLDLMPYPDREAVQTAGFERAILRGGLLFLRGVLNNALEGYILLDTGASYSAVSRPAARVLKKSTGPVIGLQGANGVVSGDLLAAGARFDFAGRSLAAETVVALDLAALSALHRVEAIGVLGYPALRASILTVSYRDGLVRIDSRLHGETPALVADKKAGAR
ncbi:MAG: aspartyl protease family protein [Acidobacteriia bacterium]|nr:aspartyl protease family protein [Terriglobia bacterium]